MLTTLYSIVIVVSFGQAQLQCPTGFRASPSGVCVFLNGTVQLDFFAAEQFCEALTPGCHLVSVHSAFDNQFLRAYAQEVAGNPSVIIGLIDIEQTGFYHWIDETVVNYLPWCPGSPSQLINDNCVVINAVHGNCWSNTNCDGVFIPACGWSPAGNNDTGSSTPRSTSPSLTTVFLTSRPGSSITMPVTTTRTTSPTVTTTVTRSPVAPDCTLWNDFGGYGYMRCEINGTWNESQAYCRLQGAQLASIHSSTENNFVMGLLPNNAYDFDSLTEIFQHTWLGSISRNVWLDGTTVTYTNWYQGSGEDGGGRVIMWACCHPGQSYAGHWKYWSADVATPQLMRWMICKRK